MHCTAQCLNGRKVMLNKIQQREVKNIRIHLAIGNDYAAAAGLSGLIRSAMRKTQQTALLEAALQTPFFRQIKTLTVQGYYTSKAGIDELNKGGRVPSGLGCQHGGSH